MKTKAERRLAKRRQIEQEIRQIVLRDSREILMDNMRRRRRHEFKMGDGVTLIEWLQGGIRESDRLYRVREGVVVDVLPAGYIVEGRTARGKIARDFVNRAHLINGFVRMFPREEG
ncbi:MAG: hypothetical protein PUB07_03055 [Clostridia bacterium]|nr:hypothetical protein [Clostridia bacterium]